MRIEDLSIEDILSMAIRAEIQARGFYNSLSEKISNAEVKKKVQSLAGDEARHQKIMEDLYRTHLKKEPRDILSREVPDIIRAISALRIDDKTQVMQVLDMAIDAEIAAARFYHQGSLLTSDPTARRIFEELEREEDGHFNYLVSEKSALSGDLYWFSISDSAMMEE